MTVNTSTLWAWWVSNIDLMHWRHVSITTTPCWGSRLVALRARVVLEERWRSQPLSQCAGPGRPGGTGCRGWPAGCLLGDGACDSASFGPQHVGAPFCDVICIRFIVTTTKRGFLPSLLVIFFHSGSNVHLTLCVYLYWDEAIYVN